MFLLLLPLPGSLNLRFRFGPQRLPDPASALQPLALMVFASFYQLAAWDLSLQGITGLWVRVAGLPLSTSLDPWAHHQVLNARVPHSSNGSDDCACLTELLLSVLNVSMQVLPPQSKWPVNVHFPLQSPRLCLSFSRAHLQGSRSSL